MKKNLSKGQEVGRLLQKGLLNLADITVAKDTRCPICARSMQQIKGRPEYTRAFCLYSFLDEFGRTDWTGCTSVKNQENQEAFSHSQHKKSLKAKAEGKFNTNSVVPNKSMLAYDWQSYLERDQEATEALALATKCVARMLKGDSLHVILSGVVGAGKTHLAIAMAKEVMRRSLYKKKALVISYPKLYDQMKFSFQNPNLYKKLAGSVNRDIGNVDVLVIDDLGAELGKIGQNTKATEYNINLLQQQVDARENKSLIVTTNLTAKQIKHFYGDRILSRILSLSQAEDGTRYVKIFENTTDGRLVKFKVKV